MYIKSADFTDIFIVYSVKLSLLKASTSQKFIDASLSKPDTSE